MSRRSLRRAIAGTCARITGASYRWSADGMWCGEPLGVEDASLLVPWGSLVEVFHLERELLKVLAAMDHRFGIPAMAHIVELEHTPMLLFNGLYRLECRAHVGATFEVVRVP